MMQVGKNPAPDKVQCMGCCPMDMRDLVPQNLSDVVDLHLPDFWHGRTDGA